jgi:hypothetical protein
MKTNRLIRTMVCLAVVAGLLACGMSGVSIGKPTATLAPNPTSTPTLAPTLTDTPVPSATPLPTATPNLAATQEYENMRAFVEDLYKQGYLASTGGKYFRLEDFSNEWAQIGWYQWQPTDYDPVDFILQADLMWESAIAAPNPSGCGIVFHLQPNADHYLVFVSTDGYVIFLASINNDVKFLADKYYGPSGSKGSANFTLIVKGTQFRVLINGKSVGVALGYDGRMLDGNLAYTIVSGTNAGFGTRCEMTNISLWETTP